MKTTFFAVALLIAVSSASAADLTFPGRSLFTTIWVGSTCTSYFLSNSSSQATLQLNYDKRGNLLGSASSYSIHFDFDWFGFDDEEEFEKTSFIQTNGPSSSISITDSTTLRDGALYSTGHSITTSTNTGNGFRDVTDQTTTTANGQSSETITTVTGMISTNYYRFLTEVRDTNGNLTFWSLSSSTNDSLHSQQFTLFEEGTTDEASPDFVEHDSTSFDSFGNVLRSTTDVDFLGNSFSNVTSNSYVMDAKGRVLSSISQTDNGADGTIDAMTQTTFTYDKVGNVSVQDVKQFGGDGTFQSEAVSTFTYDKAGNVSVQDTKQFGNDSAFQSETVSTFDYDRFGNQLSSQSTTRDAHGILTASSSDENDYVSRGQAFDRPNAGQHFLDQIRNRRHLLQKLR